VRICVCGLWHLGTVLAACLASAGHDVTGYDENVDGLRRGELPVQEPGLAELIRAVRFTSDREALRSAEVAWIAWDTPVDDDDRADVDAVLARAESLFDFIADGTLVVVSSQLPVGSVRRLEEACSHRLRFACAPENLRLGSAIESFTNASRMVAGVRDDAARAVLSAVLAPLVVPIEWMSVESAEMTKNALNAFLATSVAFINEVAAVCEEAGADAHDVARALKSDPRIGPRAYLSPGAPFSGGTLARDVGFLAPRAPLLAAVKASNDQHKNWARAKLRDVLGTLRGRTVALWGLTYKPGTDTLRRSDAVELARWLAAEGARVQAHDPAVSRIPDDVPVALCASPADALRGADALVVATEWPDYRAATIPPGMIVIDANNFVGGREGLRHYSVGRSK
jgi:UDPglucose 6-dehydrogenase